MSSSKYPARRTPPDLVWLRGLGRRKALKVEGWRSEPSTSDLCFFAPHFYRHDSPQPWLCGTPQEWPDSAGWETPPPILKVEGPDKEIFTALHSEILCGIEEGRFKKVVPYVSQKIDFAHKPVWVDWPAAFADAGEQISYGFQIGLEGMCGVTPEILFEVQGARLTTAAVAGTGSVDGPDLMQDPKERLEHEIVVEHIQMSLGDLGRVEIGTTAERIFPRLKHLYTPITVELNETPNFLDLVNRLHPTAALGGWPRSAALDFLRVRGGERGRFGAPFGYCEGEEMICAVAIRALQWRGSEGRIMVGCGVVEGSQAEREWQELNLKMRTTARQLGLEL